MSLITTEDYVDAYVGEVATLSCHISRKTSAIAMTIRWFKMAECIYLYKNDQVTEGSSAVHVASPRLLTALTVYLASSSPFTSEITRLQLPSSS
ncbi:unnamed protein product [Coregonus sp. 'balchen']|nr:unnamed protein product [Coregonus sp. 'balchen']